MISLFLIFLQLSSSVAVIKMQFLYVYAGIPSSLLEQKQREEQEKHDESINECKKATSAVFCEMIYDIIKAPRYCNEDTLNTALSNIPSDVSTLAIYSYGCPATFNLNNLKRKMHSVMVVQLPQQDSIDASTLSHSDSMLETEIRKMAKNYKNMSREEGSQRLRQIIMDCVHNESLIQKKSPKSESFPTLYLQGNINSKVNFIAITAYTLYIVGYPLDCENVLRGWQSYSINSEKVTAKYLIVPYILWPYMTWGYEDVDQMILSLIGLGRYTRIAYTQSSWVVDNSDSIYFSSSTSFVIPYIRINKLGVASVECFHYEVTCSGSGSRDSTKDLNITVGVAMGSAAAKALDSKGTITIAAKGWEYESEKPKVVVTANTTLYEIDASAAKDVGISVAVEQPYLLKGVEISGGDDSSDSSGSGADAGVIIGVVIGVLVLVIVAIFVVFIIIKTYKQTVPEA